MNAKRRTSLKSALTQVIALGIGFVIFFPILYCLAASFMEPTEILSSTPHVIPNGLYWQNYRDVFEMTTMTRYIANSFFIATTDSIIRIIVGSLAAYALAFYKFPGRNLIFFLILGTMMIPSDAIMVTNYLTIARLKLVNTYLGIMVVSFVSAMNIFMLRQYFLTISKELREASQIDGCSSLMFYWRILIPVSKPVLTTVFISSFIAQWNNYMWPMLVTNDNNLRTVQLGITMLNFPDNAAYGPTMAASIVILIPSMAVFLLFRRQLVSGITAGSVKG